MKAVFLAAAAFAAVYIGLDFNKLYALRYGADLGTFLQTIVNMAHGSSWNYGEWRPHLTVHDSWLLFALVPAVALFPFAQTLIVIQVCAVAAAAIPLALLAREIGVCQRAATLLSVAYLLAPSAQGTAYDNFSENVFVPLLAFSAALFVRRRWFWPAALLGALLIGVKEDEALFVGWFGAACAIWWDRRIGIALVALAASDVALYWALEAAHGAHPNNPSYALVVHDPSGKLTLIALLLLPFAFANVAIGRWLLLGAPLVAEIVFAQPWNYEPSRVGSHYTAPLLAAAAVAAAFGLRRNPRFARFMLPCALVTMLVIFNDTVLRPGRWPYIVDWSAYARAVALRDGLAAVTLPRREEGVWAVAAANPRVRLDPRPDPKWVSCPAYDTDARAFFGSLAGRMPARLCGGVPIP
jgi:uncharacterized membrane protein